MMSSRIVTGAILVGVLAASPALAQERHARPRGEQGGSSRGGDRGNGGNGGGERRAEGARTYQSSRAPERRSYDSGRQQQVQSRQYTAPRQSTAPRQYNNTQQRQYTAPRQYNNAQRQYTAPRAYNNNGGYNAPRQYTAPRAYNNGRSYSSRGYAAPRRDPYYRNGYYGYRGYNSYYRPYTSYSRRYVYGGYRGVYGYGGGYRHTRIVTVVPWRPYYYRPHFSIGVYYGAGGVYDYGYTPSSYYDPTPGRTYGGVRITEAPRDAQVFADGYYVGIVDDFDGTFQHVNLEAGQHRIEVRAAGIQPISFDVYVQPGRTITLRADDYNDGYAGDGNGDGY
jgi:hypothetical protein